MIIPSSSCDYPQLLSKPAVIPQRWNHISPTASTPRPNSLACWLVSWFCLTLIIYCSLTGVYGDLAWTCELTCPAHFHYVSCCIDLTFKSPPPSPPQTAESQPPHLPANTVALSNQVPQNLFSPITYSLSHPPSHTSRCPFPCSIFSPRAGGAHGFPSPVFRSLVLQWGPKFLAHVLA